MTREQIYKAELEKQYAADCVHPRDSLVACDCCIARRFRLSAALEAAAKVGGLADDETLFSNLMFDRGARIDGKTMRQILADIDAYLRGAR